MPPITTGTPLKASRIRFAYTTVARSGRRPDSPPGEYPSSRRCFLAAVNLLSILSKLPAVTKDANRGFPKTLKAFTSFQSG